MHRKKIKQRMAIFHADGRFLSNIGVDAAIFCLCAVLSALLSGLLGLDFLVPVLMGCAPVSAVLVTQSAAHGVLTALFSAIVSVFAANDPARLPQALNYLLLSSLYIIPAVWVSTPLKQLEERLIATQKRYKQEKLINDINQRILMSSANESLELLTLESLCELTGKPGVVYQKTPSGIQSECIPRWLIVYPTELSAAEKAFSTGKCCGIGTEHYSSSSFLYIPVSYHSKVLAVAAIRFGVGNYPDEEMLTAIDLIINQAALAMTRQALINEQHEIVMRSEKEKIRNDFLRAISHDLRTPLAGIISACSTLEENSDQLSVKAQGELVQDIHTEAEWLLRMVENLLAVTRATGGANVLKKTLEPIDEIIWEAVDRIRVRYPESVIRVSTPKEVLLAEMEGTLIIQVLVNLMENAIKYADSTEPIEVSVSRSGNFAVFEVRDHGKGLAPESIANLFTATAIGNQAGEKGLGIGLSICRTIVEAHAGSITGQNEASGGARFCFTLPMEENHE